MGKPTLYAYTWSSCSWRVRIALAHKGIEYKAVSVEDQKSEEFLKINPAGQIPVLEVDGYFLTESMAILEYLEETYPKHPLLPEDPILRAKIREFCDLITSGIQPLQNPRVAATHSKDPEKQLEWTLLFINRGFALLEIMLRKTSTDQKFCFANALTMADCCLAPQVYNAVSVYKMDMTPYPTILKIYNELLKLETVSSGHPDQPF